MVIKGDVHAWSIVHMLKVKCVCVVHKVSYLMYWNVIACDWLVINTLIIHRTSNY